jgi:hypothetical protein
MKTITLDAFQMRRDTAYRSFRKQGYPAKAAWLCAAVVVVLPLVPNMQPHVVRAAVANASHQK